MRSHPAEVSITNRVAGYYAAIGGVWIIGSDWILSEHWRSPSAEFFASSAKGLLFVACTALALHVILRRLLTRYAAVETALHASEERWRHALENAGDGLWDWNGETQQTFFSPRWKSMLGYADEEIGASQEEWLQRIHSDDRDRVTEHYRRHCRGESECYECEYRMRTKDGGYRWVLARGRVVRRASDGRPLRAVGTHADITARKEAEEQAADALRFSRAVLEAVPIGVATFRADGQMLSANTAAAHWIGADVATVLQQNFRELKSWQEFGLVALADRALHSNQAAYREGYFVTTFGLTQWAEMAFVPFSVAGEPRLMVIVNDTTRQHAALEQLELLHAALRATPTGWVVTDARGRIEWVNPAFTELTGYSLEEVAGSTLGVLKSGRHTQGFYANLWDTVRAGRIWQGEICNRRKDGVIYFEHMTIAPVRDPAGTITHYVAMKEDITGRRELEQRLERAQRLESIGLLASGIAHDLNNVLAPVTLGMNLIRTRLSDPALREVLDGINVAAQRGAGIIRQVLTFARGVEGERQPLDVRTLLKELANLARETFPRGIRVTVVTPATSLLVEGDLTQLHQVLLNLAINARDAMPEGGVLTLKAETIVLDEIAARPAPTGKPGDYVKLSVIDTGTGMSAEVLKRIFEPFFTTKPRGSGTGLGLSTVYGLVRGHGGFVDVSSQLGRGSVFAVFLPTLAAPHAPAAPAKPLSVVNGVGRRVLVVDDEEPIRVTASKLLQRSGFATVVAEDGIEALQRLREAPEKYSAAIVDLMMPGMSGYKLIGELRKVAPALPVIVASGMAGDLKAGEDSRTLAALGVHTVLTKPFSGDDLLGALGHELKNGVSGSLAKQG